jgi:hypothetical protein
VTQSIKKWSDEADACSICNLYLFIWVTMLLLSSNLLRQCYVTTPNRKCTCTLLGPGAVEHERFWLNKTNCTPGSCLVISPQHKYYSGDEIIKLLKQTLLEGKNVAWIMELKMIL